jgi:hypothetical protein
MSVTSIFPWNGLATTNIPVPLVNPVETSGNASKLGESIMIYVHSMGRAIQY